MFDIVYIEWVISRLNDKWGCFIIIWESLIGIYYLEFFIVLFILGNYLKLY